MANNRPEIENQAAIEHTRQAISRYATAWLAGDRASLAAQRRLTIPFVRELLAETGRE